MGWGETPVADGLQVTALLASTETLVSFLHTARRVLVSTLVVGYTRVRMYGTVRYGSRNFEEPCPGQGP
jgi:hypothetical protein